MIDDRSSQYLDAIQKRIGYIGMNVGHKSFETRLKEEGVTEYSKGTMPLGSLVRPVEAQQYSYKFGGDEHWAIEYAEQTAVDDYEVVSHIFSKCPTAKEVKLVDLILSIRLALQLDKLEPRFECWECGIETHWLDTEGDLQDKWGNLQESYCGC